MIKEKLINFLEHKDERFANGRLIRNMFDDMVMNHARRVAAVDCATKRQLMEFSVEDISFDATYLQYCFSHVSQGKLLYTAGGIILKTDHTDRKKRQKNLSETV